MKFSPEHTLEIQLSSRFVFLPVLLAFALSLLLTSCAGVSTASSQAKAGLSAAPTTLDFGTVQINSEGTSVLKLTNTSKSVEVIASVTIVPTPVFSLRGWTGPVTVNPGQTVQLQTIFTPKSTGDYSGTLTLVTSLHEASTPLVGVGGTGNGPPPIVVSLSPTSSALQSGQSEQFTSVVTGTPHTAVTWTAALGSITSSGVYTAPTVASESQDSVSAISVADPSKYASGSVTVMPAGLSGAAYSQNADSVTTKVLPNDVLSRCFGDTSNCSAGDAIAKCVMTDCGGLSEISNPGYMGAFDKASPGANDIGSLPLYQPLSTDPWYSVTASTPAGSQAITFHAPNAAKFSEGPGDESLVVWDQTTGWVVQLYHCCGGSFTIPTASGCGNSSGAACRITGVSGVSAATNLFTAIDFGYTPNSANSNGTGPFSGTIREEELRNGVINHALQVTVDCVNATTPYVFPANRNPGICNGGGYFGPQNANRGSSGTLLFLDYTPTQIASFNLPAWQTTILTALSTYGAYVAETGGAKVGLEIVGVENIESSEAWKYYNSSTGCAGSVCYNDPLWPWILSQKGLDGTLNLTHTGCTGGSGGNPSTYRCIGAFLANIPRTIGPEGSDADGNSCTTGSGCYPTGHMHVADKCVAEGYAGVNGGCS
jgi:hypothetical protein